MGGFHSTTRRSSSSSSTDNNNNNNSNVIVLSPQAIILKGTLIQKIIEFGQWIERNGDVAINFGVNGGELNKTSCAPQKIDFYLISEELGTK
jgi:hypothetical protein